MSLEPPTPVHVLEVRNPVAKWHYKHMKFETKWGISKEEYRSRRLGAQQPLLLHKA